MVYEEVTLEKEDNKRKQTFTAPNLPELYKEREGARGLCRVCRQCRRRAAFGQQTGR